MGYALTPRQRIPYWFSLAGQRWTDSARLDRFIDRFPKREDQAYWPAEAFEWIARVLCRALRGHIVIDDHCCQPEHRYCSSCNTPTPNEPVQPWVSP